MNKIQVPDHWFTPSLTKQIESKTTKWDHYFRDKKKLELNFSEAKVSKQPLSSRAVLVTDPSEESLDQSIFNFSKKRGEELFNEIIDCAQM